MRNLILLLFLCMSIPAISQHQRKVSGYLSLQYTNTIADITKGNNPWGIGLGLQGYYNTNSSFRPALDVTGDIYLDGDKVLRTDNMGNNIIDVGSVLNVFAGAQYLLDKTVVLAFVAGPSFIENTTSFGIKPSIGIYLSKTQRCEIKTAYIMIFNRDKFYKKNFTSFSIGMAVKLF